jgi:hypothetical protein
MITNTLYVEKAKQWWSTIPPIATKQSPPTWTHWT